MHERNEKRSKKRPRTGSPSSRRREIISNTKGLDNKEKGTVSRSEDCENRDGPKDPKKQARYIL